jgi:hypothetical protein
MTAIINQLDFILPAVLVMMLAVYMLNRVLNHDHTRRVFEYKKSAAKQMVPLRAQAYERLTLFLERMQPSNLLIRVQTPSMKAMGLHRVLIQTIRSEYDHNMSQQVYVSDEAWELINQAKDQLLTVINEEVRSADPNADATEFGKLIIEASIEEHKWLIDDALSFLKKEFRDNY